MTTKHFSAGLVAYTCNLNTQVVKAEGSIPDQPGLQARPISNKQTNKETASF